MLNISVLLEMLHLFLACLGNMSYFCKLYVKDGKGNKHCFFPKL